MGNRQSLPSPPPPPSSSPISILSLPDEMVLEILSHVPMSSLTSILLVCRRFSQLRLPRCLNPTLHVFHFSRSNYFISSSTPLLTPNSDSKWSHSIRRPMPKAFIDIYLVSLGRFVYILGYRVALRYNTWTKISVPVALTLSPREIMAAAAVNGKIYVAGGISRGVEEYDPSDNKWRNISKVPLVRSRCVGAGAASVFYIIDTLCPGAMDAFDVCTSEWLGEMPAPIPDGGCVFVGSCATPAGHVYIITSHRGELRFWRWKGRGKEWERLEGPVVPQRPGLVCKGVEFRCVAAGDDRVVAVVNINPLGQGCGWIGRDVLVYDVVQGQWSRGPNLPLEFYSEPALAFTEY